jgi:hypothetical protein
LFLLPDVVHLGVTVLLGANLIVGRAVVLPRSSWPLSVVLVAALAGTTWISLKGQQLFGDRPIARLVLRYLPWALVVLVTLRYRVFSVLPIAALVAFAGIMTLLDSSPWLRNSPFPPVFGGIWILYWLYIGGDYFDERFLIILFPLGIFALLESIQRGMLPRRLLFIFVGAFIVFQLQPLAMHPRFGYTYPKYDSWILLGEFLGRNHTGEVVATGAAGKIPYFSKLPTIDMLGLNDEFIAHRDVDLGSNRRYPVGHNKYDADYVLSREPDLIGNWIDYDGNMSHGLDRAAYERHGYRLRYLLNTEKTSCPNNIVDTTHLPEDVILRLIRSSYKYAVIERSP